MLIFRITKNKYASDLSGKGAELIGGRWNLKGTPALYCSENRALTVLEFLANLPKEIIPKNLRISTLEIPASLENKVEKLKPLTRNWNSLQTIELIQNFDGQKFEENKLLGFIVPSAILDMENNVILNPTHKDFDKIKIIKIDEFKFDKRLFKK